MWVKSGVGAIKVNGRTPASYFPSLLRRADVLSPFIVTSTLGAFDVYCTVRGGGSTGRVLRACILDRHAAPVQTHALE